MTSGESHTSHAHGRYVFGPLWGGESGGGDGSNGHDTAGQGLKYNQSA
jgi:hypothetical protein